MAKMMNHLIERLLAVLGLVLTSPLFLIFPVLIRLDSDGPGYFLQARVGKDGRIFMMYKFRTMIDGAVTKGTGMDTIPNDPRITRVGRVLRRRRLDRLPQLINIAKGDMSFWGPRPLLPRTGSWKRGNIPDCRPGMFVRQTATGQAEPVRQEPGILEKGA